MEDLAALLQIGGVLFGVSLRRSLVAFGARSTIDWEGKMIAVRIVTLASCIARSLIVGRRLAHQWTWLTLVAP